MKSQSLAVGCSISSLVCGWWVFCDGEAETLQLLFSFSLPLLRFAFSNYCRRRISSSSFLDFLPRFFLTTSAVSLGLGLAVLNLLYF